MIWFRWAWIGFARPACYTATLETGPHRLRRIDRLTYLVAIWRNIRRCFGRPGFTAVCLAGADLDLPDLAFYSLVPPNSTCCDVARLAYTCTCPILPDLCLLLGRPLAVKLPADPRTRRNRGLHREKKRTHRRSRDSVIRIPLFQRLAAAVFLCAFSITFSHFARFLKYTPLIGAARVFLKCRAPPGAYRACGSHPFYQGPPGLFGRG